MKIRLTIEYNGMKFCGWQRQDDNISVQETIEIALGKVFNCKERIIVHGAGRTDSGVHAIAQIAHFEINDPAIVGRWSRNCDILPKAINSYMFAAGAVIKFAEVVDDDFHARFSAKRRNYRYLIYNNPIHSALYYERAWFVRKMLDVDLMNIAAQDFIGKHDLQSFRSSDCGAEESIKSIYSIEVLRKEELVIMDIAAKSFLHNQVRIIIGTLKDIGLGKFLVSHIKFLLQQKDRTKAGQTAPPYGLYLRQIEY